MKKRRRRKCLMDFVACVINCQTICCEYVLMVGKLQFVIVTRYYHHYHYRKYKYKYIQGQIQHKIQYTHMHTLLTLHTIVNTTLIYHQIRTSHDMFVSDDQYFTHTTIVITIYRIPITPNTTIKNKAKTIQGCRSSTARR